MNSNPLEDTTIAMAIYQLAIVIYDNVRFIWTKLNEMNGIYINYINKI